MVDDLNNRMFKPTLTREEFDELHETLDKVRSAKRVTIPTQALSHILMDQSVLWDLAGIQEEHV